MTTFRVHAAGSFVDVPADNPNEARKVAAKRLPENSIITKVKVLKAVADA